MNTKQIAQEIAILMPQIARRILFEFFHTVDIPQTQIFAMMTLYDHGGCNFSDLSKWMHVSAPTVTGIIDRMEKSGYVKRQPSAKDRRSIDIVLTPKGEKISKQMRRTIEERWEEILSKLTTSDQEKYLDILQKIKGSMHEDKRDH